MAATARRISLKLAEKKLREFSLDYPDAVEEFPWDQSVFKVNKKIFVFLSPYKGNLYFSVKLPKSRKAALENSFAAPTGYGLGKHGWVTATFKPGDEIPMDLLTDWIDESFRAIAPKKIVAFLDDDGIDDEDAKPIIRRKSR